MSDRGPVVLVRHAQTAWSMTGRHTGRTDIELTDRGRAHAREVGERLDHWDFATVLCSPLSRARETAELARLGEPTFSDDLLEWDYGDYEGVTSPDIKAQRPGWWLWTDGCPGGEGPAEVAARVDVAVAAVEAAAAAGPVAVVAHGHVLRAFGARWCEADVVLGGRLRLDTGALCVLGWEHDRRAIERWNLT